MGSDLPSVSLPRRATAQALGATRRLLGPAGHGLGSAGAAVVRVTQRACSPPLALVRRSLSGPLQLAGDHLTVVAAAGAAALCVLLDWLLGSGLEQWFVAQGMDDERAYLLSALVLALLATAAIGAASRRPGPTRAGGLVGFVAIQIVPFLIRAANAPGTPGLRYTENVAGWILQPLGMLLLAYIPMTHMAHFIAKYFTYHRVRWDERANVPGGTIEKHMAEYLMYRPTWSASHVGADGQRTWAEVATTNPTRGGAK